jgi:hypothetical protein
MPLQQLVQLVPAAALAGGERVAGGEPAGDANETAEIAAQALPRGFRGLPGVYRAPGGGLPGRGQKAGRHQPARRPGTAARPPSRCRTRTTALMIAQGSCRFGSGGGVGDRPAGHNLGRAWLLT